MKISGLAPSHQVQGYAKSNGGSFWNSSLIYGATLSGNTVTMSSLTSSGNAISNNTYSVGETSKRCFEVTINAYNQAAHNPFVGFGYLEPSQIPTILSEDLWSESTFLWSESHYELYYSSDWDKVTDTAANPSNILTTSETAGEVYGFFVDFSTTTVDMYFNGAQVDSVDFSYALNEGYPLYVYVNLPSPGTGLGTNLLSVTAANSGLKYPVSGYLPW
jgi:hypothetical protein